MSILWDALYMTGCLSTVYILHTLGFSAAAPGSSLSVLVLWERSQCWLSCALNTRSTY